MPPQECMHGIDFSTKFYSKVNLVKARFGQISLFYVIVYLYLEAVWKEYSCNTCQFWPKLTWSGWATAVLIFVLFLQWFFARTDEGNKLLEQTAYTWGHLYFHFCSAITVTGSGLSLKFLLMRCFGYSGYNGIIWMVGTIYSSLNHCSTKYTAGSLWTVWFIDGFSMDLGILLTLPGTSFPLYLIKYPYLLYPSCYYF